MKTCSLKHNLFLQLAKPPSSLLPTSLLVTFTSRHPLREHSIIRSPTICIANTGGRSCGDDYNFDSCLVFLIPLMASIELYFIISDIFRSTLSVILTVLQYRGMTGPWTSSSLTTFPVWIYLNGSGNILNLSDPLLVFVYCRHGGWKRCIGGRGQAGVLMFLEY